MSQRTGVLMPDNELGFDKEALPLMIEPYQEAARKMSFQDFHVRVPYPVLLFARSQLWDPLLLMARHAGATAGRETAVVSYEMVQGGRSFLSPVRKRQTNPEDPTVMLGRTTKNDMVVPVNSISGSHCIFTPPAAPGGLWTCRDLDTKNGTYLREDRMTPGMVYTIENGTYLRLGGNMIAWFLYPDMLWQNLQTDEQLKALTDL